jgi:hypothetical protein
MLPARTTTQSIFQAFKRRVAFFETSSTTSWARYIPQTLHRVVRSPISTNTRLRHGQVPAERQKYIPASCTAHKMRRTHGYLARRSKRFPTQQQIRNESRTFIIFSSLSFRYHFPLDSQCAWILFPFFLILFFQKKRRPDVMTCT